MNTEMIMLIILLANTMFSIIYLLYGVFIRPRLKTVRRPVIKAMAVGSEFDDDEYKTSYADEVPDLMLPGEDDEDIFIKKKIRRKYVMTAIVFFLFPVGSELIYFLSWLFRIIFFRRAVDLEDVVFDKSKKRPHHRGDEERERNLVPLEEALAVTDAQNLRNLMINVLKGETGETLRSIVQALNSDDSETAHYAASVLSDELNDFRSNVQTVYNYIEEKAAEEEELKENAKSGDKENVDRYEEYINPREYIPYASALIKYIATFIFQHVFTEMEEKTYARMLSDVGDIMFEHEPESLLNVHYAWINDALLQTDELERCEKWVFRAYTAYPDDMVGYTGRIKLHFKRNEREEFLKVMHDLEESDVVIDRETLELIRAFR